MNQPNTSAAVERIRSGGIIAIIRGRFTSPQVLAIADALATAGVTAIEVTLNSPDALKHILALRANVSDRILVGAGTVRNVDHVSAAIAAGAVFLISPGFDPASVAAAVKADVLHLPGVYTATEAQQAASAGARMLKLFPCDTLSPTYLKALRAPLDDVDFVPTGGVSIENIGAWRKAGAAAVAMGSKLVSSPDQSPDDLIAKGVALRQAWEAARG